jgi:hypothetical protein
MSKVPKEVSYSIPRIGMLLNAIPNPYAPSHNISNSLQGL